MVDITAKLFWYRSKEWCAAMADKLTDVVYTDDSKETIDVINLLLLGWILLGLVVYIIGNVIATYLRKRKSSLAAVDRSSKPETPTTSADDSVPCANDIQKFREDVLSSQTIIPTCEGEDEEFVNWVNRVTSWIYTQRVVSPIIDSWLSALNARTRLSSTEHGILVDFRDLLPTSGPPKVTEVRQNTNSRYEDTNLTCDMEFENIAFEIVVTQFKEKEKILLPFVLQVKRLFGKVAIECNPEDVGFTAKYSEPPQIEMHPEVSNEIEIQPEEYEPLCDVVTEITSDALSSAIVPLRLSCFPDCPRIPTQHTPEDVFETAESEADQKLLVKIIKASNLGGSKGCQKPYCVVEMIDPPQKFETQVVEGTQSPFWDEAYTFSVKDPAELLFEIYDKDKSTSEGFLGLGIVNTEELMRNPSQRQIIPLQSRPLEEDDVTGSLTVEFLFLDRPSPSLEATRFGPPPKQEVGKTVETNSRVTAGGTVITTTTIKRTKEDGGEDVAGTALKELEKQHHATPSSKSTLIIHSVHRPESSMSDSLEASPARSQLSNSRGSYAESDPSSPTLDSQEEESRSRPKEKRSFMGTLRRRLSFHKTRSKSAENRFENGAASSYSQASSRSASTDRIRHPPTPTHNRLSPFKGRRLLGSTRSSLSEASGISAATYINENSTLVIETNENGIVKRYLIPNSLVHRSKWKKRGTKLHIFNDHVFIAKHLSGSTMCQVCKRHLTRRPGKQGYECRGCNLQCHKSCHVKVDNYCSNSSINSMEVEYIHDPKGASPKSI